MTIYTPQVASRCGAIDSDAVADGQPYGAHWLRPLIRSANRTIGKQQQLASLFWPEVPAGEDNIYAFEGIAPLWWVRVYAPIHVRKRPGLASARIDLRVLVPPSHEVEIYFATTVRPWNPQVAYDKLITGTGSFADVETTDIPIAEGTEEAIELWLRGRVTSTLAAGGYGGPNTNTGLFVIYGANNNELYHAGSTWNFSGVNSLGQGGHAIQFYDADGVRIGGPRQIVGHTRDTSGYEGLRFEPPMTPQEIYRLDSQASHSAGGSFEIVRVPTYVISNILIVADERSP